MGQGRYRRAVLLAAWLVGGAAGLLSLLGALWGWPFWELFALVAIGVLAVGYGWPYAVALALFYLVLDYREEFALAPLAVLALAFSLALISGVLVRGVLRERLRKERRIRRHLALFLDALEGEEASLEATLERAATAVREGTGLAAEVHLWDAECLPEVCPKPTRSSLSRGEVAKHDDRLYLPLFVQGDPFAVLVVGPFDAMDSEELRVWRRFARALSERLTLLYEKRTSRLLAEVGQALVASSTREEALSQALGHLIEAVGADAGGLLVETRGRYQPVVLVGDVPASERDRLFTEGLSPGEGLVWRVYQGMEPLFLDDAQSAEGAVRWERVRAQALYPLWGRRRARAVLSLRRHRPDPWRSRERALVGLVANLFSAAVGQWFAERRLRALLDLQRLLAEESEDALFRSLLEAAVELVPGAEAGSLLVREGRAFFYRAAVGYPREALATLHFDERAMRDWCGAGFESGAPRVLSRAEVALEAISHRHADPAVVDDAGRLKEMAANLCVPIRYRGQVLAVLNLDAFSEPRAFDEESLEVAREFAVEVAALLHELDLRRQLAEAALTDALTGLPNRRAFERIFEEVFASARRYGEPLSLVVMDLRRFKQINDTLGHDAGDEALKRVVEAIEATRRNGDLFFRWGGDEFAFLMPHTDCAGAARAVARYAERVREVCFEELCLDANFGIACFPADAKTKADLLRIADARMYRAKAAGVPVIGAK